jgi:hypothetical protein
VTMIDMTITGADTVIGRVTAVERAASDFRPVWDVLAARFVTAEVASFAAEGGGSGPWRRLSPGYAAWKAVAFPGKTILRRTDALYHSLTDQLDIDIREAHTMVLGSDVGYGRIQARQGRPAIDLPLTETLTWIELIEEHIVEASAVGAAA